MDTHCHDVRPFLFARQQLRKHLRRRSSTITRSKRVLIAVSDSIEIVQASRDSPEYKALVPLRDKAADYRSIIIEVRKLGGAVRASASMGGLKVGLSVKEEKFSGSTPS
jgi:Domain of unknown function (DUF1330)